MKSFKSPGSCRTCIVAFAGLLLLFFSSCLKDKNYPQPSAGALSVIQASPDQPLLNFFLNTNLVNTQPMQFGDFVCYVPAYAGTRQANFFNVNTMTMVFSDTINIQPNQNYSLFLANIPAAPLYLFLTDTLKQPVSGQAGIRFINLGPDAGAVDFKIGSLSTVITNKSFLGYSGFVSVSSGTYTLVVNQAGTSTALASESNITLNSGSLYTVWLQGLKASVSSTDKLGLNIMVNAF